MRVEDLMTRDVVTVPPELPLREAAQLLVERGIGGVPVCDVEGQVLGVLSEADIVRKEQGIPAVGRMVTWLFEHVDRDAAQLAARTAGEAMTWPAATIGPRASVSEAACKMIERGVRRLPVVLDGSLVGIIARADLVRAFCRADAEIARELSEDVLVGTLWLPPEQVEIAVADGVVTLKGELKTRTEAELVEAYAQRVPGVVEVSSELTWRVDDLAWRTGEGASPRL